MVKKQPGKPDIVRKALELAAQKGWETISLSDIAQTNDMSLADLHELFQDKTDILITFGRMIDRHVLENMNAPDPETTPREALFDLLMDRFEALNEYRNGLTSILRSFCLDPKQAVISMPHLCRSMTWMLEAAGIETNGLRGAVKVAGLTGLYLKILKIWQEDDSSDLSKTMAALDKDLNRVERWANSLAL